MDDLILDTSSGDLALPVGGATYKDPQGIPGNKDDKISARSLDQQLPIKNITGLKSALKRFKKGEKIEGFSVTETKRHIIKNAKKLASVALLPSEWNVSMELSVEETQLETDFIWLTADELQAESKFVSAATRKKLASKGEALSDGSFPIPNKDFLRRAIQSIGRAGAGKRARVKAHIIKRAKALGASSMLPDSWGVTAEEKDEPIMKEAKLPENLTFQSILVLEGDVPQAIILEQTDEEKASGTLKVKMPFYVGGSVAKPPMIPKRVYFPTDLLSETIAEGKKQIAAGKQPLTVYARHNHALSSDYLPIGGIVGLERENNIGYVILEIEPTTYGKDAQILLQAKPPKLNAISLRSGPKRFELEDVTVNGEAMFKTTKLLLDGVDFAPDSPAMPTHGFEILTAEATITSPEKKKEVSQQVDVEITLETVRAHPEIVEEIEKPLLKRIDDEMGKNKTLLAENTALKNEQARNELTAFVTDMASKHPKKDEALKIFLEIAAKCKTKEEFSAQILPYFVNAATAIPAGVTAETIEDKLKKLFPATPSVTLIEEETEEEVEFKGEHVGPLEVPA